MTIKNFFIYETKKIEYDKKNNSILSKKNLIYQIHKEKMSRVMSKKHKHQFIEVIATNFN
jgi:hypothetical protein